MANIILATGFSFIPLYIFIYLCIKFSDLYENSTTGIFCLLGNECKVKNPSLENFTRNVYRNWEGHSAFVAIKPSIKDSKYLTSTNGFIIRHFAGDVTYATVSDLFIHT